MKGQSRLGSQYVTFYKLVAHSWALYTRVNTFKGLYKIRTSVTRGLFLETPGSIICAIARVRNGVQSVSLVAYVPCNASDFVRVGESYVSIRYTGRHCAACTSLLCCETKRKPKLIRAACEPSEFCKYSWCFHEASVFLQLVASIYDYWIIWCLKLWL